MPSIDRVQLVVGTVLGQWCSCSAQGVVRALFQWCLDFDLCKLMISTYRYHRAKLTVEIMGAEAAGEGRCTGHSVTKPGSIGLQKGNGHLTVGCDSLGFALVSGLWENYRCGNCVINVCIKGCVSCMGIKPGTLRANSGQQTLIWHILQDPARTTGSGHPRCAPAI